MQNMFLKLDGIKGETTIDGYKDQIEVYSFSHGCSQPIAPLRSSEGGGTTSRANHSDMSLSKRTDLSTPDILKALWQGKTIKDAVLTCCRVDGDSVVPYLTVTMEKVVVSSYSVSGGGDLPMESLSLNYSKVTYDYKKQKEGGGQEGTGSGTHDLETNKVS